MELINCIKYFINGMNKIARTTDSPHSVISKELNLNKNKNGVNQLHQIFYQRSEWNSMHHDIRKIFDRCPNDD